MSQDPLARLRRRERRTPPVRAEFPDPEYREAFLEPARLNAEQSLARHSVEIYRAHAVMLAERRVVEPSVASAILSALDMAEITHEPPSTHPLAQVEASVVAATGGQIRLGSGREEIAMTAMRLALRDRWLDVAQAVLELRTAMSSLALQHLTTLLLATANGQVVQPTSLGHYLAGQIGPLARTSERVREAFVRLNQSPMGAVSGMATATPILRSRQAELLGFEGLVESTFDALAGGDVMAELAAIVALAATELTRLVADLNYWARDDVGTVAPSDAFVHRHDGLPQRRDPLVLDHLRVHLLEIAGTPQRLTTLLSGRQMLGGEATSLAAYEIVNQQLDDAVVVLRLLGALLATAEVDRALFAHRSNRGFPTSSELVDLLAIDFEMPRNDAVALVERIVVEVTEGGGEATTLRTEQIDEIALRSRGQEIGIEAEMLAKVLSPKRFIERRDHPGGPSPGAVRQRLERETFTFRRDEEWLLGVRDRLERAAEARRTRAAEIAADPDAAIRRPVRA